MHDAEYCRIPLVRRDGTIAAYTLVDVEDFERLGASRWHLMPNSYAARGVRDAQRRKSTIYMHREILGLVEGDPRQGDHINRDRLDNRRSNLRAVTFAGNRQNTGKKRATSDRPQSQYRGVQWCSFTSRWMVRVSANGKVHNLGRFDDEHEAGRVAVAFRREHVPLAHEGT